MGYLSHRVDPTELKPGDHIYTWRTAYVYSHHGIYVGENKVVHFTAKENDSSSFGWNLYSSYALTSASCLNSVPDSESSQPKCGVNHGSSSNPSSCSYCVSSNHNHPSFSCLSFPDCGFKKPDSGVIISCLNCFTGTGNLYLFQYGVKTYVYMSKLRGGTCTTAQSDAPQEVIHRAMCLLQNGFGSYDVVRNNCEDFSLYCKTGLLICGKPATGSSGQVNFIFNAPWKCIVSSNITKIVFNSSLGAITAAPWKCIVSSNITKIVSNSSLGAITAVASASTLGAITAVASAGEYCYDRYKSDIGVRNDTVKVKVEDMPLFRGH